MYIQLYKNTLKDGATPSHQNKYKLYRKCLTKNKWKTNVEYYTRHSYTLNPKHKKQWKMINNITRIMIKAP